jgi:hypothetical protein
MVNQLHRDAQGLSAQAALFTDVIRLRSLAGPRCLNPEASNTRPTYSLTWGANLLACEGRNNTPCDTDPTPTFIPDTAVASQWVDQQTYGRHASGDPFGGSSGGNLVRDWIEAMAWDALSAAGDRGGLVADAANCVVNVAERTGSDVARGYAFTESLFPKTTVWYPQNFDFDALRWDHWLCISNLGMKMDHAAFFTSTALHESRHCWQAAISASQDNDHDDLPATPESIDPLAQRLKDAPHASLGGIAGSNFEAHFGGDTPAVPDPGGAGSLNSIEHERDASFFEQTATASGFPHTFIGAQLGGAQIEPGDGNVSMTVGALKSDAIRVKVSGDLGVCPPIQNTRYQDLVGGIPGVVVEFVVSPASGLTLAPRDTAPGYSASGGRYVAVTVSDLSGFNGSPGPNHGYARLDATASAAGTYTVSVVVRQLVPEGNALASVFVSQSSITVTVNP